MIHSKNKRGFSLTEVMLSIAIISMAIAPLLILQSRNSNLVKMASRSYNRFLAAYAFLFDNITLARDEKIKERSKKIADLQTQLTYSASSVPNSSSLKAIPNILIERVTINWQDRSKK